MFKTALKNPFVIGGLAFGILALGWTLGGAHAGIVLLIVAMLAFLVWGPHSHPSPNPYRGQVANPYQSQSTTRAFRNPLNGYVEEVGTPWLWCLLLGCIYFAARGIWTHAVAAFLLAIFTGGISWLIYPLFARQILETNYLRRGWLPV
jgi:hypothetical protein